MRHEKIFLTEEKYNLQFSWWGSVYLVSRLPDQCRVTVRGVAGAKWPLVSVSPTCTGVVTLLYSTVQYSIVQYSIVQYSTVQHSTIQYTVQSRMA